MIESGYIKGKFEKTLPFFILGESTNNYRYNEQKRNLETRGAFTVIFNSKHTYASFIRGYILPIVFCIDDKKRDFFLKLQRVIKKNRYKRDFKTIINKYLKDGGFEYLELSLYSYKNGYISFKIKKEIYSKLLCRDFSYVTKILDGQSKVIEVLNKNEFKYNKYIEFLEAIYGEDNLLKREIIPFRLHYVFENTTYGQYSNYEKNWGKPYAIAQYKLQNYFNIKESYEFEKLDISIKDRGYGWIDIFMNSSNNKFRLKCSDAFDPFLYIYNWLNLIKSDDRNHSFVVDEEGTSKVIEAYPFEDKLYLIIYDDLTMYDKEDAVYFEGVLVRDKFIDNFLSVLEDFLLNDFEVNRAKQFWRDEPIYKVRDIFIEKNKSI